MTPARETWRHGVIRCCRRDEQLFPGLLPYPRLQNGMTRECAEFVQTGLGSLSTPAGTDDDRTHEQRYHDALQEAMRRLLAAGQLPERSGQLVKAWARISLADLMLIEGSSTLLEEWSRSGVV